MASRLVRLKAQMLLPRGPEEDGWEDPRAELVRRLLEYQQIREIAVWMGRVGRAPRRAVRPRLSAAAAGAAAAAAHPRPARAAPGGGAGDRRRFPSPVLHRVVARPLDVEGATRRIEELLDEREQFGWLEALGPRPTIVDVLSTLLALLELAKRGSVRLAAARRRSRRW